MATRERNVPEKFKGRNIYSYSRLSTFNNCPYSYYLGYIKALKGRPNIYSHLGGIAHELLEKLQVDEITIEKAINEFKNALLFCEINEMHFPNEQIKKNYVECILHFFKNYSKMDAKKILIEKEFYTEINGNVILGYIDLIILNHDGTIEIFDYKTSSKFSKNNIDKYGLQLILYAMALEQEFGVSIKAVKWNMLKYCIIEFQGATKLRTMFAERNKWVEKIKTELLKDLRNSDYNDFQVETALEIAIKNNSLETLPEKIQKKYIIKDGFIEYPLNVNTRTALVNFLTDTIANIEAMPHDESKWIAKDIKKEGSFFCGNLCDHKDNCKFYSEFVKQNISSFKPKKDNIIDMLFK